jgi:glycosyltransferase involved in cell wall biosynthesis
MTAAPRLSGANPGARATVVVCAYTAERWELLSRAIDSIGKQTLAPHELIVSIDHNHELFEQSLRQWGPGSDVDLGFPVRVVENRYSGRLGSARTTAAELATGDLLAFLDDDAAAEPEWLEHLLAGFENPQVIAIGGAPLPDFATTRPRWFPPECDWVFGCVYDGLPTATAPVRHVIGAAMSVRRRELLAIGGFHSDNHDDMDMCHRLVHYFPGSTILFEPSAVVRHHVPPHRLRWSYFWRRCFFVNRGKVQAFRQMGGASNLTAESQFARRALSVGLPGGFRDLRRGDVGGILRAGSLASALALAAAGYAVGSLEWAVARRSPSRTVRTVRAGRP